MVDIAQLRKVSEPRVVAIGSYPAILQAMLDFDFLSGKEKPSIVCIIASGRRFERYFFGKKELLIPVFPSLEEIPTETKETIHYFLNLSSGRRVFQSTSDALDVLPNVLGGVIFAENTPEKHAIALFNKAQHQGKFIIGPSSVGLLLPGILKLGAIGGVDARQLISAKLFQQGTIAVLSSSGGMTNELINIVTGNGKYISVALSFGGDRFPLVRPLDAFLALENDPNTTHIVYFGELGGYDEYELAQALKDKKMKKPVICYIAGVISDIFPTPPQFGHAKAMAEHGEERAVVKREVLKKAGAFVPESFSAFVDAIRVLPTEKPGKALNYVTMLEKMSKRKPGLITTTISKDEGGVPQVLGEDLLPFAREHSFAFIVGSLFLGKKLQSKKTEAFIDFVLRLLVDHGPYVSGAVNSIITARAGKDLVSSLSAGLLTIGPRFGGAINQAAANWLAGVGGGQSAFDFVEGFAKQKKYISGIGHRKYRVDLPDPRVAALLEQSDNLEKKRFTEFAKAVETVTVSKKGNLILNVDGAIAAILLDLLSEEEGYSDEQLAQLTDSEFFNALFVLSRSVGFIAHFLDQKRLDEGLFRLDEDLVVHIE